MLLLGWISDDRRRHYGASAAERAQQMYARMSIGELIPTTRDAEPLDPLDVAGRIRARCR